MCLIHVTCLGEPHKAQGRVCHKMLGKGEGDMEFSTLIRSRGGIAWHSAKEI